jgi:hypothetical protein
LIANLFNPSQFGSIYLELQKYLRKVIHLRKGNQLATITETAAEIGDGPGGRHHPWPRRALVLLAHNISPLLHKQLVLELECRKARLEVLERFPGDLVRLAFPFDLQLPRVKRSPSL